MPRTSKKRRRERERRDQQPCERKSNLGAGLYWPAKRRKMSATFRTYKGADMPRLSPGVQTGHS